LAPLPFVDARVKVLEVPYVVVKVDGVTIASGGLTVTETEVVDATPAPAAFTARIATVYAVPFVKPAIDKGDVVEIGERVVHPPEFKEY
jgi:hypothetical protein